MQRTKVFKTLFILIVITITVKMVACGGGSSSSHDSADEKPAIGGATGTGSAALFITDGPIDIFSNAYATLNEITLIGNKGGPVTLFIGEERVDLLNLRNFLKLLSFKNKIPTGDYNKIRLVIKSLSLVRRSPIGEIIQVFFPELPANGKIDINFREKLTIESNQLHEIELDFDMDKSILIVENSTDNYVFRPVIFVKTHISTDEENNESTERTDGKQKVDKFVLFEGIITTIDDKKKHIEACPQVTTPVEDINTPVCLTIKINGATDLFKNGEEASVEDIQLNDLVKVTGRSHGNAHAAKKWSVMARMIEIGDDPVTIHLDDISVVKEETEHGEAVIELTTEHGKKVTITDDTQLFSHGGKPINQADLVHYGSATIGGVHIAPGKLSDDNLLATWVIVDDLPSVRITGTVMSINATDNQFIMATNIGDRCVVINDDTKILNIEKNTAMPISLSDLITGPRVDAYGDNVNEEGCYTAHEVLMYAHHGKPEKTVKIPQGHIPPEGQCRAWLPNTPPGKQPPPGDCASIDAELPAGAVLIHG